MLRLTNFSTFQAHRYVQIIVPLLAIWVLFSTIYGIYLNYSPTLYWDQWGALTFYIDLRDGDWGAFWRQHNEHRIVFSRLFFYADFRWFGGKNFAALGATYFLLAGMAALLYRLALSGLKSGRPLQPLFFGLAIAGVSSWAQYDNLIWGFQSQFVAVYFFALLSFYLVHRSAGSGPHAWLFTIAAAAAACASAFSMSNGLLCFPVLLALGAWLRVGGTRWLFLALTAVTVWLLYFHGYEPVVKHGSPAEALLHRPLDVLRFAGFYLGSPIYFVIHRETSTLLLGTALIACGVWASVRALRQAERGSGVVLLAMLLFLIGTAVVTGAGRIFVGPQTAVSSRYCTPALFAWLCLLLYYLRQAPRRLDFCVAYGAAVIGLLLLSIGQTEALHMRRETFERNLGGLAARMGVFDERFITKIFPASTGLELYFERADRAGVRFGPTPEVAIGAHLDPGGASECLGAIEDVTGSLSADYLWLRGWIYEPTRSELPRRLVLTDGGQRIIGVALSGEERPDVEATLKRRELGYGWQGFVRRDASLFRVYGRLSDGSYCRMPNERRPPVALLEPVSAAAARASTNQEPLRLGSLTNWAKGALHSTAPACPAECYGTWITPAGDANTGTLMLLAPHVTRLVRLTYLTGPADGRQFLDLFDEQDQRLHRFLLPATNQSWQTVEVHSQIPFAKLRVIDAGPGWGEWSAISLTEATPRGR